MIWFAICVAIGRKGAPGSCKHPRVSFPASGVFLDKTVAAATAAGILLQCSDVFLAWQAPLLVSSYANDMTAFRRQRSSRRTRSCCLR